MYDYIIVGAGSAGCVLAGRLTENFATNVLLLEAGGPDRHSHIATPAAFAKLFRGPFDWAYTTEPQPHLHGRRLYWPRGKVLGGSSSVNALVYIRGHRHDYDAWAAAVGPSWAFDAVLPYFKKAEDQERGASDYHGVGGPLHVSDSRCLNVLSRRFVEAGVEAGLTRNDDFNGPDQDGVGFYQRTVKNGRRHSAADAYLKPALRRPNLTVRTGAHVTRVLLRNGRAAGVEFREGSALHQVEARREVVLCGGAVNSPQLLLLSGIGPADHLREVGVPVAVDLPGVGDNLQDHLLASVSYACTQPVSLATAGTLRDLLNYLLFKRGPLTSNVAEAGAFVRSRPDRTAPDLQFHFAPVWYLEHGFQKQPGHGFGVGPTVLRPRSRGHVRLRSADPLAPPAIQPNYLADEEDLRLLVEGLKLARLMVGGKALHPFRGEELYPGAELQDDAALANYVRRTAETLYHPAGTCKMGTDPQAVVDPELRVRGVAGLRVADASIMPTLVGGNTNAPTIMIGEKAADLIQQS